MARLAAPPAEEEAQQSTDAKGGKCRGDGPLLDASARAFGMTFDLGSDPFGRDRGVFLHCLGTVREAISFEHADRPGKLAEIGPELFDLGLQRGKIAVRLCSHGCPVYADRADGAALTERGRRRAVQAKIWDVERSPR